MKRLNMEEKRVLREELDKFDGAREFHTPSNPCYQDGIFAKSLLRKYEAESLAELRSAVRFVRKRPKKTANCPNCGHAL